MVTKVHLTKMCPFLSYSPSVILSLSTEETRKAQATLARMRTGPWTGIHRPLTSHYRSETKYIFTPSRASLKILLNLLSAPSHCQTPTIS